MSLRKILVLSFTITILAYLSTGVGAALQPAGALTYEVSEASAPLYLIGGFPFVSSQLSYNTTSCPMADRAEAPFPAPSCWQARVSYAELSSPIYHGLTVQFGCFAVTMKASGVVKDGVLQTARQNNPWKITYSFTLTNPDCLKSSVVPGQKGFYEVNQPAKLKVETQNLFGRISGGYYVLYSPLLFPSDAAYFAPAEFNKGGNSHEVALPSTVLGAANVSVYPYLFFGSVLVMQDAPANRVVQIFPKLQLQNLTSECSALLPCASGKRCASFGSNDEIGVCVPLQKPTPPVDSSGGFAPILGAAAVVVTLMFSFLTYLRLRVMKR